MLLEDTSRSFYGVLCYASISSQGICVSYEPRSVVRTSDPNPRLDIITQTQNVHQKVIEYVLKTRFRRCGHAVT